MHLRLTIICFFLSFWAHSQLQIDGLVLDKTKQTPLPNSRITLYLFQRDSLIVVDSSEYHPYRDIYYDSIYKKINRITTGSNGHFLFTNLDTGVYKVTAESLMKKTERGVYFEEHADIICPVLNYDSNLTRNIYLSVFCPFDSTRHLTLCHECNKADKLREFQYGLPSPPLDEDKYIYTFDCSPPRCRPSKYCLRCNLSF